MKPTDLVAWRDTYGYTQARLAEALGYSESEVWRWENGHRPIPVWLKLALRGLLEDSREVSPLPA